MRIFFEYGKNAVAMPTVKKSLLLRAGKTEFKLLFALTQNRELAENYEENADAAAQELKVTRSALDSALGFWIGAGVLSRETDPATERKEIRGTAEYTAEMISNSAETPKRTKVTELPQYTKAELAEVLEKRLGLSSLIEEAQHVLGKVFNQTETQLLVGISEGLGLEDEYILNLLAYCKKMDKANMRYVEKTAVSLYDKGIHTPSQLEAYLRDVDRLSSAEGRIRKIFGMGERAFTTKESSCINNWINTYGFDFEMIKLAYEETVNNTAKPSVAYANSVLESWFSTGVKSPADLEKRKAERGSAKKGAKAASFDVDDFFNAAINRGFDDKKGE